MPAAIKSGVAHNKEKLKRLGTESETGKSEFRTPGTAAHMSVRNRGVCWLDLGFLTQIERLHVVPSPPPHHVEVGETSKQPTPDSSTSWAATELFSCQPPKGNCSSVCLSVCLDRGPGAAQVDLRPTEVSDTLQVWSLWLAPEVLALQACEP